VLWALPGVSRCGPLATGAYLKEQSWYYDLARGWDGSFEYQGEPAGGQEHGKYTHWDCTGAYLLACALPLKSLCLTGKKPCSVPALNAKEVLPQLKEMSRHAGGGNKDIDKLVADIDASTDAPPQVELKDFVAGASASGAAPKSPKQATP